MNTNVLRAVFTRNFVSYYTSPIGYVFIWVFVLLSSVAAFWPFEFFNSNLANLDQLNKVFPLIMLIFIPAITMSVWAEERRQGTDELLLTIPAGDFDIVLGKYLAAVAIYTVSLLFSLVCNFAVLRILGEPDVGLFLGTYFGYWLVGLAMLAVGVVASFLTGNLTIAFVLGALFNLPLVLLVYGNAIEPQWLGQMIKQWSIGEQFAVFGRGIFSLSGLAYFATIMVVMLYLSMVLIGRRHWREGQGKLPNYVFYPLLHVGWLASFVTFWIMLNGRFNPTNVFICLSALYLLLHAGLLWCWSLFSGRSGSRSMDPLIAMLHLAVIGGFVIVATLLNLYVDNRYVLIGAIVCYLLIHAVLLFGWIWFAGHAALLPGHYTVRVLALVLIALGAVLFFSYYDLRVDVTSERLSSLAPETRKLLRGLDLKRPVQVEAFLSPVVPESYVQARLNLLTMLEELRALGGSKVQVRIHEDVEQFTEEADRAEGRFNITPRRVLSMRRGTLSEDFIFMGVAFTCGLEKVVLPFIDRGIPAEYELARSIWTVSQQDRKKIGILRTDAQLYGRFNMQAMSTSPNWPIIDELEKMYELEEVDPSSEISERYHALLAVQPSSLGPEEMRNFIAAIRDGQPTAIFEDPFPAFAGHVPATTAERRPPGGMNPMMMRQPPMPKGHAERQELWRLLGVDFAEEQVVWQNYSPFPKLDHLPAELVFVDRASKAENLFNESEAISSKLELLLFPFPGSMRRLHASQLEFEPLVRTGQSTGTVDYQRMFRMTPFGPGGLDENRPQRPTNTSYVLAAHITGKIKSYRPMEEEHSSELDAGSIEEADDPPGEGDDSAGKAGVFGEAGDSGQGGPDNDSSGAESTDNADGKSDDGPGDKPAAKKKPKETEINVVLVADIDMLHREFFLLREQGANPEAGIDLNFDNVTFVLNVLDVLAGDEQFVNIRKRRPKHRTLSRLDAFAEKARADTTKTRDDLQKGFEEARDEEQEALDKQMDKLREEMKKKKLDVQEIARRVALALNVGQQRMQTKVDQLEDKQKREINKIETDLSSKIRRMQDWYKMWAVVLPPIPPLVVAVIVFFTRRAREREGVARSRLR